MEVMEAKALWVAKRRRRLCPLCPPLLAISASAPEILIARRCRSDVRITSALPRSPTPPAPCPLPPLLIPSSWRHPPHTHHPPERPSVSVPVIIPICLRVVHRQLLGAVVSFSVPLCERVRCIDTVG